MKLKSTLASEVMADYERRKNERKYMELQWNLNLDFVNGKQNNHVTKFDTITTLGKQFFWQGAEVFNHIAPMVEARLSKIASILPESNADANMWSEITGTSFYKVVWDKGAGSVIGEVDGKPVHEGGIRTVVCSPFEIYPDKINACGVNDCRSIIHAKTIPTDLVQEIWGEKVTMEDKVVVIEKYVKPTKKYPQGRLITVANNKLLYEGSLPYVNQFPFVAQKSETIAGCFYGRSVVERAIPVQRAYNALKNRQTEFLNRLACGVLTVEEGSVDLEALENDGLAPGKVIVYRQGSTEPKFMDCGTLPAEIEREGERLLGELYAIAGVAEMSQANSGVALQILVEQDQVRLSRPIKSIEHAMKEVKQQENKLEEQFRRI